MADNKQYITLAQENGSVIISEDVIGTIVIRATEEVEGVAGLSSNPKKVWGKSIRVAVDEKNRLSIDCNISIYYGQSVVSVASAVQESISNAINSMTGVKAKAVNVNVCGIIRQ